MHTLQNLQVCSAYQFICAPARAVSLACWKKEKTTPFGVNLREASTMPGMVPGCLSERGQIFDVILPHPAAPRLAYNRSCSCVHACMHDYLCCVLLTGQVRRWGSYVIL